MVKSTRSGILFIILSSLKFGAAVNGNYSIDLGRVKREWNRERDREREKWGDRER